MGCSKGWEVAPSVTRYTRPHLGRPTAGEEIDLNPKWAQDTTPATEAKQTTGQPNGVGTEGQEPRLHHPHALGRAEDHPEGDRPILQTEAGASKTVNGVSGEK